MPTSTGPLQTPPSTAVEGDQKLGVINITDVQNSPHQFPGTIDCHVGQMLILPLTQIDVITKLVTIIGIGVIHIPHLITCIMHPITPIIITVICNVI